MNLKLNRLAKIIIFCFGFFLFNSEESQARNLPTCQIDPADSTKMKDFECYSTPTIYEITIYEMGLCVSDPLNGTTYNQGSGYAESDFVIDESSCEITFKSDNGIVADLAQGQINLVGQDFRPPSKQYNHAYLKFKNSQGITAKFEIDGTSFCSKNEESDTNALQGSPDCTAQKFNTNLIDFRAGSSCSTPSSNYLGATYSSFDAGIVKALLTDISYNPQSSCAPTATKRIYGSFEPVNPINIDNTTKGLQVSFSVTNKGLLINTDNNRNLITSFAGGPLTPTFEKF